FEAAMRDVGWKRRLRDRGDGEHHDGHHDEHDHGSENDHHDHDHSAAERHGVASVVYERSRPFHPERFADWLDDWSGDVVRAKGFFWVVGREGEVMGLSQAGPSVQAGPIGSWGDDDPETRLVFIGRDLDEGALADELDAALATDEERRRSDLPDPFPLD
ncbi:CobW family GTP-binding protein, partial [Halobium palmae]